MCTPQDISIKRPFRISQSKTFEELGILVLDGSGSMDEQTIGHISKADAVSVAVNDFFARMRASKNRNNFSFAVINYDHRSMVKMQVTEAKNLDDHGDYNPMKELGGATYISEGLKDAKKIAEDFLSNSQAGGLKKDVLIMIMTDGVDMTQPETISMANTLKQMPNVKIAGCFFETLGADAKSMQECADYLKGLCSEDNLFTMVNSAEELRKFFAASVSNVSGTGII